MFGKKKNKVRRPTGLELTSAIASALIKATKPETPMDHQMYGQVLAFFQGPLRALFLQSLESIANQNGYFLNDDPTNGLLFIEV